MTAEQIACVCHNANATYCQLLGDYSAVIWGDAPDWQKDSAIAGVHAIMLNPDTTSEQIHQGWLARKAAEGWVCGPIKDADSKTHPCMLPYEQLPEDQRRKDALFGAIVRALL